MIRSLFNVLMFLPAWIFFRKPIGVPSYMKTRFLTMGKLFDSPIHEKIEIKARFFKVGFVSLFLWEIILIISISNLFGQDSIFMGLCLIPLLILVRFIAE